MVGVDADQLRLEVKGVLAVGLVAELVLVQVGPAPDLGIHHMGEPFPACHLHTSNEREGG